VETDARALGWRDVLFAALASCAWVLVVRAGPIDLPYFWDEADVYVPGARWVAEHGLTITPGVFPDDYSRGHPPLLYLIAAIAFRAFGTDPTVGHALVLPFTALAIASTYLLGASIFDRIAGFAAAALLAATPLFMSIGNMLLPEMPLTALSALALLFFARGKLGLAVLCGVAMVWIKETGIFTAGAIGLALLYESRRTRSWSWRAVGLALVPLLALLVFFAWQRASAGYFVFPHHQNLFADRPLALENAWTVLPSLGLWHGRWLVILAAIVALGSARVRSPHVLFACAALVVLNAIFFAKMFWLERYALPAHPGLLVCAAGLALAARGWRRIASVLAIGLAFGWGLASMRAPAPPDAEEHTFAYADVIATHQAAFAALEPSDAPVLTTWPLDVELEHPYLGYVEAPLATVNARYAADERVSAILINTASGRAPELREEAARRGMRRVERFRIGVAPAIELYR
jgi:4-amino-4-deoxy-L-arabinose transferase-like glycosyltransferase